MTYSDTFKTFFLLTSFQFFYTSVLAIDDTDTTHKNKRLEEVIIKDSRSQNEEPVFVGKISIKPMDLPQSTMVIDKDVLEHQQVLHISEALQNVNGVYVMSASGGVQEELAGRGYAFTSSNTFKNGIRYNNATMPEVSSLERIEILKGSAAILYGNVAAGGVLNIITKKPRFEKGGEVSMRVGSYDLYKPSIDMYGAINKSQHFAYRVNASYEKEGSFRNNVSADRFYINPSLLIKINERTDILLEGDYLKDRRTLDYGTGAINYKIANVPREQFLGTAWSYYNIEQQSATATITHHINDGWEISNKTGYQNFKSDLFGNTRPNASGNMVLENGDWVRGLQRTTIAEQYYVTQFDLTGKFKTGFLGHQLLVGADADQYLTGHTAYNGLKIYDTINIYDLNKYTQRSDIPSLTRNTVTDAPISRLGAYAQDLISFGDHIKLLAGLRYTYQQTGSDVYYAATDSATSSTIYNDAWTPRLGLVYQPTKTISLFASYANSFVINTGVDIDGKALPPSYINQFEAGVKTDFFHGLLSANITAYQIVNSNLAQTSSVNANAKELAGEVTSRGVEVDVMSKSYHGFTLIAGYSYNQTKYTQSNTYIVGSLLRYNPNHTANASIYYEFDRKSVWSGLSLGAGAYYVGDRVAGRSTTEAKPEYKLMSVPAFTLFDASVGYTYEKISVRFKMTNLLDKLSYNVHDDNSVNPIAPRQFAATVSYKF